MTMTFKTIVLAAVASLSFTGVASANEAFLSDDVTRNAPTRISYILSTQPRADSQASAVLMSKPSDAIASLQLDDQINAGDQSVEDVLSILSRIQQQRVSARH